MIGLRQSGALPSFQMSWGGASTRDDLHAYLFKEIAPVLVLMVYSFLSHRMGYRLPDKLTAAVAKPGVLLPEPRVGGRALDCMERASPP
jgi:hypothetical protein